jgi:hypothetical protein
MRPLSFFYPVLQALEDGRVIRKAFALVLQIFATLQVAAGLFLLIELLKISFRLPSPEATLGGVVFAAILVVTVACTVQIGFYRAASIRALGDSPFTVIPIFSVSPPKSVVALNRL